MIIINFGQVVDILRGGQLTNQFTVELPNRERVIVNTDEQTVQQLMTLAASMFQGAPVAKTQEAASSEHWMRGAGSGPWPAHTESAEVSMAEVFGGEEADPGEAQSEPVMGTMAEEPMTAPVASSGLGSGKPSPVRRPMVDKDGFALPVTSRTVEKDEMGYPVVAGGSSTPVGDDGADDGTQI